MQIFVPKGQSVVEVLISIGDNIKDAWLYFHNDTVKELLSNKADLTCADSNFQLNLEATEHAPEAKLYFKNIVGDWAFCNRIQAENIPYNKPPDTPDKILFISIGDPDE